MNTKRWEKIEQIFQTAADLAPEAQKVHVKAACGDDRELYNEILALLKEDTQSHSLLDGLAIDAVGLPDDLVDPPPQIEKIGKYKIIREIATGGMGIIYLAEIADGSPPEKFALKLLKWWGTSESSQKRFQREQKILAQLDHPNIARLIEVGFSEDELPFIVMEYVDGEAIDSYCDRLHLSIEERLRLFRDVCDAVQYAHRKQVVHRDLKPDNILVKTDGTMKLLDFGISKMLKPSGEDSFVTLAGMRMMTPEYASPEQVRGKEITAVSDVYALGVVLYELLTGVRPIKIEGNSIIEVEQAISRLKPEKPGAALQSLLARKEIGKDEIDVICQARNIQLQELNETLAGDLDNICLSALEKEPNRRYPSVMFLSEDIRRYLAGEPILARRYD